MDGSIWGLTNEFDGKWWEKNTTISSRGLIIAGMFLTEFVELEGTTERRLCELGESKLSRTNQMMSNLH